MHSFQSQPLQQSLTAFITQHHQYNEAYGLFPGNEIRFYTQPATPQIDERIPMSPELTDFYTHCKINDPAAEGTKRMKHATIEIGDGPFLDFPAPEELYRQQLGYRWITTADPNTLVTSPHWPEPHVVIANANSDPIIVDTSVPGSPVYGAIEGGQAKLLARSLADFFQALAILIEAALAFDGQITDEDTYEVKPDYVKLIKEKLSSLLEEEMIHHLLDYLSISE